MTMTITEAMTALVAELEEGEVPAPLTQRFTLGAVWVDLARLAGEALPPDATTLLAPTLDARDIAPAYRGPHADHAARRAELAN